MFSVIVIINLSSMRDSKSWSVSSAWLPVIGGGGVWHKSLFCFGYFLCFVGFFSLVEKKWEKGSWTDLTHLTSQYKTVWDSGHHVPASVCEVWGFKQGASKLFPLESKNQNSLVATGQKQAFISLYSHQVAMVASLEDPSWILAGTLQTSLTSQSWLD